MRHTAINVPDTGTLTGVYRTHRKPHCKETTYAPALIASRSYRFPLLACLTLLNFLALQAAQAQMPVQNTGGSWVVTDANGKTITQNSSDGSYMLYGDVTLTAKENYPGVLAAANNNPLYDGAYVPDELTPNPNPAYTAGGHLVAGTNDIGAYSIASNADQVYGSYVPYLGSVSAPVFLNGAVGTKAAGTLTQTWTWVPAPAPGGSPPPTTLTLLVSAPVSVDIVPNYSSPSLTSGLTGTASASNEFGDMVSMTEGTAYAKQSLPGLHLIQLPVGAGGKVTVTVSGQTSVSLTNSVLYGAFFASPPEPWPTGPVYKATNGFNYSTGSADVTAAARQDSRAVNITADCDPTNYKILTGGVDANGDGLWAKVAHKPAEMKGDIAIPYGSQQTQNKITTVTSSNSASVRYTAHIPGDWATQNSHFWWKSSLKNYSTDDSLYHLYGLGLPTEAEIPTLGNTYNGPVVDNNTGLIIPNDAAASGSTDNISFQFKNGDNRTVYPAPQFATGNDGDGATATAGYALTIHQPVEVFPSHRPNEIHFRIATPSPRPGSDDIPMDFQGLEYCTYEGKGSNGVSAVCVLNSPYVAWSLSGDATSALSSVPYPGWWGVLDVIFAGANIFVNHATPQTVNFTAHFNDTAWDDPLSDGDSYYQAKSYPKTYFHMSPRVRVNYRWTYKLVDVYNAKGF